MRLVPCLVLSFALLALPGTSRGATGELSAAPMTFGEESLRFEEEHIAGEQYDFITMPGLDITTEIGRPCIPVKTVSFYIPRGKAVKGIRIDSIRKSALPGAYLLMPAQPESPLTGGLDEVRALPEKAVYSSPDPYPASPVSHVRTGYMAGRTIASVQVFPLQYVPADRQVILNTNIVFTVELADAEIEPPIPRETENVRDLRNSVVKGLVSNGSDVEADFTGGALDPSAATEYLIIAIANHADEYELLRQWKTRKGVPAEIVSREDVLATYSGRDDPERIRNCILDYYLNQSTDWVVLTTSSPKAKIRGCYCAVGSIVDDFIPCDLYFADLDGDWNADGDDLWGEVSDNIDLYSDVYVGRIPANTGEPCAVVVDKILTYEGFYSYPTDYQLDMLFLAEYADPQTDGGIAKDLIDTESVPARFSPITKLYESSGNLSWWSAMSALNSGQGFVNHDGHGSSTLISIGPSSLDMDDAMALTNAPRYMVLYTVACNPGNFHCAVGCFGRSFIESPDGGGFFVGNSRYGWYWPGHPGYGTGELYDREFFKSMFTRGQEHLGVIHADAKAQRIPYSMSDNSSRWTQFTSNVFGCPETPVWLDTPMTLAAAHDATIEGGPQSFSVYVTNAGTPLTGARVCLWKADDLYEVLETAGDGLASFSIAPADTGNMMVTVTKNGYLPYAGSTWVSSADAGVDAGAIKPMSMKVSPNPAAGSVRVTYALPGADPASRREAFIEVYDARGRRIDSIPVEGTTTSCNTVTWDGRSSSGARVPAGIYFLKISDGNDTISTKFVFLR